MSFLPEIDLGLWVYYKLEILTDAEAVNDTTQKAFTSVSRLDFLCLCPLYSKDSLTLNVKLTKHDDSWSDGERQLGLCVCRCGSHLWMPAKIRVTWNELDSILSLEKKKLFEICWEGSSVPYFLLLQWKWRWKWLDFCVSSNDVQIQELKLWWNYSACMSNSFCGTCGSPQPDKGGTECKTILLLLVIVTVLTDFLEVPTSIWWKIHDSTTETPAEMKCGEKKKLSSPGAAKQYSKKRHNTQGASSTRVCVS